LWAIDFVPIFVPDCRSTVGFPNVRLRRPNRPEPHRDRNKVAALDHFHDHAEVVAAKLSSVSSEDKIHGVHRAGYVVGVVDSFNNDLLCVPAGVTKGELVAVVLKFLNDHPRYMARSGGPRGGRRAAPVRPNIPAEKVHQRFSLWK
jgi:hypothetical protein